MRLGMTLKPLHLLAIVVPLSGCVASPQEQEQTGNTESEVRLCATGVTTEGVDVSHWDGSVNWAAVKAAGVRFAFAKATEGTGTVDNTFATNWAGMKAQGIIRGAYHFFHPGESASAQASLVADTVGALGADDLPIVCDLETTDGVSSSSIVSAAVAFLQDVTKLTGKQAMLYASPGFLSSWGGLTNYPLWVANYGVSCPTMPSGFSGWNIWQSSESGTVSGIGSNVDIDAFNGTLADLVAFANGSGGGGGSSSGGGSSGGSGSSSGGSSSGGGSGSSSGGSGSSSGGSSNGDCTLAGQSYVANTCTETLQCDNGSWVNRTSDPSSCDNGVEPSGACITDSGSVVPENTCTSTLQCDNGVWVDRYDDPTACL
jgi:lysozyme